jgi:transcriptional regulator with XRE-family HTH domain
VTPATQQPTSLADLVRDARTDRKMSLRDVETASGGTVGFSQVSRIEQGQHASVKQRTLVGLSTALGIPMEKLRAANGDPVKVPKEPFVLPERASLLPMKDRRLVLALVDGLLAARRDQ